MTDDELLQLAIAGRKWEAHFRARDGFACEPAVVKTVLCFWCRKRHSPAEVEACMAMPRPVPVTANGSTSSLTAKVPPWLSQYPEIWEFLSRGFYEGGAPRQLGKVSLGLVSDGIQVTLTDPSSSTYCSRHFQNIEDALLTLEVGLKEGTLAWKPSGPPKGKRGR